MQTLKTARVEEWKACLEARGYRLTSPRKVVVEILANSQHVLTPLQIYEIGRQRYARLGLVTVYRTLETLEQLGMLWRVHQPHGCQGFVAAPTGHFHLLICQECGHVEYFSGDHQSMEVICGRVAAQSGFHIRDHWLQLFGVCSACQA